MSHFSNIKLGFCWWRSAEDFGFSIHSVWGSNPGPPTQQVSLLTTIAPHAQHRLIQHQVTSIKYKHRVTLSNTKLHQVPSRRVNRASLLPQYSEWVSSAEWHKEKEERKRRGADSTAEGRHNSHGQTPHKLWRNWGGTEMSLLHADSHQTGLHVETHHNSSPTSFNHETRFVHDIMSFCDVIQLDPTTSWRQLVANHSLIWPPLPPKTDVFHIYGTIDLP